MPNFFLGGGEGAASATTLDEGQPRFIGHSAADGGKKKYSLIVYLRREKN